MGKAAIAPGFFENETGDAILCGSTGIEKFEFGPDDGFAGTELNSDERRGGGAIRNGMQD